MDLLLTVAGPTGEEHDVSVSVDPGAPVEELARALAEAIGSPPGAPRSLLVERTGERLSPKQPVGQADLRFGDRVVLADPQAKSGPRAAFELVVTDGAGAGRRIPLTAGASVQVGRDPTCDLSLNDDRVSRRHLHIGAGSRSVQLTDLGSSNGTYVDGDRVTGPVTLKPGQIITAGGTTLTVRAVRAAKATDAAVTAIDGRLAFAAPPRIQRPTPSPVIALP
ncbi:MAG: FHA domain-containing protein, partial [Dactylosporangium sp.]|nr:FHA domain-containing protein [Dactylosporangium sp.]